VAATRVLIDHGEIRRWAEERRARPACVRARRARNDIGQLTLDLPGFTDEESLQTLSWDEWFSQFDRSSLALMVQDETGGKRKSQFNKLVSRDSVQARSHGHTGAAAKE
jgi:hypothetical protein